MKKGFKICPYCGKEIRIKAVKCQYCLKFLEEEKKGKECPFCLNNIDADLEVCPYCDEKFNDEEEVNVKDKKSVEEPVKKVKKNESPKRNPKKEAIIGICVLLGIFLIGFIFKYFEKIGNSYEPFQSNVKVIKNFGTSDVKTYTPNNSKNNGIGNNVIKYDSKITSVTDMNGHKFGYGTISVGNITIMDRNLGAEEAGTGFGTFGYYYQRGNNYGFFGWLDPYVKTIEYQVNAGSYGPGKYNNSNFVLGYESWDLSHNDDLWGNKTNTNIARQGPCPTGWHVPTMSEWQNLIDIWESLGNDISKEPLKFIDDFKLPLAGFYGYLSNALIDNLEYGYYWTSSPYNGYEDYANVLRFYVKKSIYDGKLVGAEVQYENHIYRVNGAQVRCFKN